MASLLVASVTNLFVSRGQYGGHNWMMGAVGTYLRHRELTLETTPDSVINTLGFPPCLLHSMVTVGLVAPTFRRKKGINQPMPQGVSWCRMTDLKGFVRFLTMGTLVTMSG